MINLKVHRLGPETLVACCDAALLGKTLIDGELELNVSRGFYGGESADEEEFILRMGEATTANLMGDKAVELAVKHGFISEENVVEVCSVKHAQMYRFI